MWKRVGGYLAAIAICTIAAIIGCGSGSDLFAYVGGGVPPGEPDIGGVVVASADTADIAASAVPAQDGDTPVVGAPVKLYRGQRLVGLAATGEGGYFRFENPATGAYQIAVEPPPGSDLRGKVVSVVHTRGQQTFTTIRLQRGGENGPQ